MKKAVKSLWVVSAAFASLAVSTESHAVPAFARQMGAACNACHQQHFPVLNTFGQAFKSSGYTMMGSQGQVEGEHLSIPGTLNAAILFKGRYVKTNGTNQGAVGLGGGAGNNTNNGQWQFGDEFSLFFGGRVAENVGFMFEGNLGGSPNPGTVGGVPQSALAAGIKIPFMYDVSDFKVGVIPFSTDALGAAYGFELASTGAVRNIRWAEHRMDISAQQYVGTATAASGLAFVAKHDMGYVNFSRWTPNHMPGSNGGAVASTGFSSHYLRAAVTPSIGEWNVQAGVQIWGGQSEILDGVGAAGNNQDTKATSIDAQAHGAVSGLPMGVYFTYAKAPAGNANNSNLFNPALVATGGQDRKAWTVGADLSVIPNKAHIGAAVRRANTGAAVRRANTGAAVGGVVGGANESDNSWSLMGIYDLAQNIALHVNYSKRSGSAYDVGNSLDKTVAGSVGDTLTTFLLEMAW
ncbi:MAG: hypothetical protein AB1513_08555 [Pseudomonadota bacterium]